MFGSEWLGKLIFGTTEDQTIATAAPPSGVPPWWWAQLAEYVKEEQRIELERRKRLSRMFDARTAKWLEGYGRADGKDAPDWIGQLHDESDLEAIAAAVLTR